MVLLRCTTIFLNSFAFSESATRHQQSEKLLSATTSEYTVAIYIYMLKKMNYSLISIVNKICATKSCFLGVTGVIKAFACIGCCSDALRWWDTTEIKSGLRKEQGSENAGEPQAAVTSHTIEKKELQGGIGNWCCVWASCISAFH